MLCAVCARVPCVRCVWCGGVPYVWRVLFVLSNLISRVLFAEIHVAMCFVWEAAFISVQNNQAGSQNFTLAFNFNSTDTGMRVQLCGFMPSLRVCACVVG